MSHAAVITLSNDASTAAAVLQVRSRVRNAADAIAPVWPLKTFIACNPLQGFEGLAFEEAVKEGEALFGGRGYRPAHEYRERYARGEIAVGELEAAIQRRLAGTPATVAFGGATLAVKDVLFAHVAHGPAPANASPPSGALADSVLAAVAAIEPRQGQAQRRKEQDQRGRLPERETIAGWIDRVCDTRLQAEINRQAIKWCAAFLDEGQAAVPMPGREAGFFAAWRRLAVHDRSIPGLAEMIAALPEAAEACIVSSLDAMGIAEPDVEAYLRAHLAALPGWAGFIKWRADSPSYAWQKKHPVDLVEYIAIRLSIEQVLVSEHAGRRLGCQPTVSAIAARIARIPAKPNGGEARSGPQAASPAARLHHLAAHLRLSPQTVAKATLAEVQTLLDLIEAWPEETHAPVWLEAAEETYRDHLAAALAPAALGPIGISEKAEARAQLVFCIDVRSEPFRRALEQVGPYETYGFAGFFGIPIRFVPFAGDASADLCPVLLQPRHDVTEAPDPAATACARRHLAGVAAERRYKSLTASLKSNIAAPFAFVESVGALSGLAFAGRTVAPLGYGRSLLALKQKLQPQVALSPVLDLTPKETACGHDHDHEKEDLWGLTVEEQAFYAAAGAKIMGLSPPFSEFVVLCAHGSTSTNNPYAAALDCGACGGNHGGPNARVMAAIFNRAEVRALLARQGIEIPTSTLFLAAEHNTTTDEVTIFNADRVPESHRPSLARLQRDLLEARRINAANRRRRLPEAGEGDGADVHVAERSLDWAQVRPEWGLARNAAFIVGPRSMTSATDLEGRCFLHSYDWRIDEDAKSLEIILTAPMVVAQWINCQYYFSTVDNEHYGSGNKITLNVTGKIGVMQGNASDLMAGLPWQSVMAAEGQPYHEPLRLMTVVMAPVARLATLIGRNTILQRLFDNEWVALLVIDPETGRFLRYRRGRTWTDVTPKIPAVSEDASLVDALADAAQPLAVGPASAQTSTATAGRRIHSVPTIPA